MIDVDSCAAQIAWHRQMVERCEVADLPAQAGKHRQLVARLEDLLAEGTGPPRPADPTTGG